MEISVLKSQNGMGLGVWRAGVAILALGLVAGPVVAQTTDQTGRNQASGKAPATQEEAAVVTIATATNLVVWARANRDADGLITAARMLKSVPTKDNPVSGTLEGPAATTPAPNRPAAYTPATLLTEARGLARGDRALLAKIRAVETEASRGVVSSAYGSGALRMVRDIPANGTWRFTVDARGGSVLRIHAAGDGDTDVDMVITDQNGNEVCADRDYDAIPQCGFVPAWSGRFTVRLINNGSVWTRTSVISN
jgi:hypothetical protein